MNNKLLKKLYFVFIFLLLTSCAAEHKQVKKKSQLSSSTQSVINDTSNDEVLNEEVVAFLNSKTEKKWTDNAYIYAWGMDKKTDNVYQTGLEIAKKLSVLNANYDYIAGYDSKFLDDFESIDLPHQDDLCDWHETNCFMKTVSSIKQITQNTQQFTAIKNRYETFLSYPHFSDTSGWVLDDNFIAPKYRVLVVGMRLRHVHWIEEILNEKKQAIPALLHQEAIELKRLLAQSNSIIEKMVLLNMYSQHVEFVSALVTMGWVEREEVKDIESLNFLTGEALSLEKAFLNEQKISLRMLQITFEQDHYLNVLSEVFHPEFTVEMTKTNTILNTLYFDFVIPLVNYMKQSPQDFYQHFENLDIHINFDEKKNPAGALLNISADEVKTLYLDYQERLFSVNLKVQLLNGLVAEGSYDQVMEKAKQGFPAYLSQLNQSTPTLISNKICFDGLFERNQHLRCMNLIKTKPVH